MVDAYRIDTMRLSRWLCGVAVALLVGGCVGVYKIDVQQGNDLSERQVRAVALGMSRSEIRNTLGVPLVSDPFHDNRWDYYYKMRKGNEPTAERRLMSLFFDDDVLARVEGGIEGEFVDASEIDLEEFDQQLHDPGEDSTSLWSRFTRTFRTLRDKVADKVAQ